MFDVWAFMNYDSLFTDTKYSKSLTEKRSPEEKESTFFASIVRTNLYFIILDDASNLHSSTNNWVCF